MAVGSPPIAVAALGLTPVITGIKGNIASQLAGSQVMKGADTAGKSIGSRIGSTITGAVKTTLKIGGVVAGAVTALTLKGGIDRALGIEDAQAKMRGLGHDTGTVDKIMANALASVEGTSYGLDAAATTAAGAVAAGIKPGQELESVLTTVANTAAATGGSMDEMGSIFNTVAAVGAAYTGDINMIAQRGVPMWQALSDVLGVSQDEVRKMATQGKIDFETFAAAAELASGDVATAMGNTTRGSIANMLTAFSKLGADVVTRFLPMVRAGAQGIQRVVQAITAKLGPVLDTLFASFTPAATAGIEGFFDRLVGWIEGFDPQVILNFFENVKGYVSGLDFSGFTSFFDSLGSNMGGGSGIGSSLSGVGASLAEIGAAAPELLASSLSILNDVLGFLADHSDVLVTLLPFLVAGFVAFRISAQATTTALFAQRSAYIATLPLRVTSNALLLIANGLELANTRAKNRNVIATNAQTVATGRSTVAERARNIAMTMSNITTRAAAVGTRLFGAALRFAMGPIGLIITGITLLAAGLVYFFTQTEIGQKVWSVVWGHIKAAAGAVVDWFTGTALPVLQAAWSGIASGAIWLYENAILPAWSGIRTAIGVVGDWITGTLWPAIQTAWSAIGDVAMWLYDNAIKPAWSGIRTAVGVVADWITGTLWPAIQAAWEAIGAVAMWLWQNIIQPAWTGIRIAIAIAATAVLAAMDLMKWAFDTIIAPVALWLWRNIFIPVWDGIKAAVDFAVQAVRAYIDLLKWYFEKVIAPVALWLWRNVFSPVWEGIKIAVQVFVSWFANTAWPWLQATARNIQTGFEVLRDALSAAWAFIRDRVINPVVVWFRDTAWPLINRILGYIKTGFNVMRDSLRDAWRFIRNNVINPVVTWFRDTVWPLFRRVIGQIRDRFVWFRDRLRDVWQYIKNTAIRPVVDWFADTVKPKIDDFTGKVRSAFDTLKDNVLKAWDGIKSGMKSPINGVIEIYNKHIAGNFNKVADTLQLDDKYRLARMNKFDTGGYTGPGSKYQPAGIVHADEYVIRKESQQSLRRDTPGFLDALNRFGSKALGYATGGWVKPFRGNYPINSQYRTARRPNHAGVDFPTPSGTPMIAVSDGTIVGASYHPAAGNKMSLQTDLPGIVAGYHHLSRYRAAHGSRVSKGDVIAYSGNTGRSTGPHLHFSIAKNGRYVNPNPYLQGTGTAGDADGGGWWNPFSGLWDRIKNTVSEKVGDSPVGGIVSKVAQNTISGVGDWVMGKLSSLTDWASGQVEGAVTGARNLAGAARWTPVATQALSMKGQMSQGNLSSLLRRMNQESSFNPRAINNWDVNARAGNSSRGLMQVIPTTFQAYKEPGYNDIWAPLDNILASINYTLSRYGSLQRGWNRAGGYADGGLVKPFLHDSGGWHKPGDLSLNQTRRPEAVLTNEQWATMYRLAEQNLAGSGGGGVTINGGVHGYSAGEVAAEIEKRRRRVEALYARV